jgi:hypothetical protein
MTNFQFDWLGTNSRRNRSCDQQLIFHLLNDKHIQKTEDKVNNNVKTRRTREKGLRISIQPASEVCELANII